MYLEQLFERIAARKADWQQTVADGIECGMIKSEDAESFSQLHDRVNAHVDTEEQRAIREFTPRVFAALAGTPDCTNMSILQSMLVDMIIADMHGDPEQSASLLDVVHSVLDNIMAERLQQRRNKAN